MITMTRRVAGHFEGPEVRIDGEVMEVAVADHFFGHAMVGPAICAGPRISDARRLPGTPNWSGWECAAVANRKTPAPVRIAFNIGIVVTGGSLLAALGFRAAYSRVWRQYINSRP